MKKLSGNIRHILTVGLVTIALSLIPLIGSQAVQADTVSNGSGYGGVGVAPGGNQSYPVHLRSEDVKPGELVNVPLVSAPNGSPVTVTPQENLTVNDGKVIYPAAGYYHYSFSSADGSYYGVILVEAK